MCTDAISSTSNWLANLITSTGTPSPLPLADLHRQTWAVGTSIGCGRRNCCARSAIVRALLCAIALVIRAVFWARSLRRRSTSPPPGRSVADDRIRPRVSAPVAGSGAPENPCGTAALPTQSRLASTCYGFASARDGRRAHRPRYRERDGRSVEAARRECDRVVDFVRVIESVAKRSPAAAASDDPVVAVAITSREHRRMSKGVVRALGQWRVLHAYSCHVGVMAAFTR
jgi:hypothetical protein